MCVKRYKNTYILLSCSNLVELDYRLEKLKELISKNETHIDDYVILISGNEEVKHTYYKISEICLDQNLLVDDSSKNTIENIVHSFTIMRTHRFINIPDYEEEKTFEIITYGQIHIISSDYHIERVKFICNYLDLENILFHIAETTDKTILISRQRNENIIMKNLQEYKKKIDKYNF